MSTRSISVVLEVETKVTALKKEEYLLAEAVRNGKIVYVRPVESICQFIISVAGSLGVVKAGKVKVC